MKIHRPFDSRSINTHASTALRQRVCSCGSATELRGAEHRAIEQRSWHAQKLQTLGRLSCDIVHDLHNMLTVVQWCCDLANQKLTHEHPARMLISEIAEAGEYSSGLMRQLLDFSRPHAMQPQIVNLNDIVSDMQRLLRRAVGEQIRLETTLDPAPVSILADAGQIEHIVINVAVNARDAMPRGGRLAIVVSCLKLSDADVAYSFGLSPGDFASLTISDDGSGMDPGTVERIFEPYFTTKAQGKGTGLGLATVHDIVKHYGGQIFVVSEPDRGTTFQILLPRRDKLLDPEAEPDRPAAASLHARAPTAKSSRA